MIFFIPNFRESGVFQQNRLVEAYDRHDDTSSPRLDNDLRVAWGLALIS
jgi:hypothetical protein